MREYTVYIAEDETEFQTKEECMAYEAERVKHFDYIKENVRGFSAYGDPLSFEDEDSFLKVYDRMMFVIIEDDFPPEAMTFLREAGYDVLPHRRGIYHYTDGYEWQSFDWVPIIDIIKEWY